MRRERPVKPEALKMYRNLSLLLLLSAPALFAQKGSISGSITAMENGRQEPLPFVNVTVVGTTLGAATDLDGHYTIPVEAGTYQLAVSYVGYEPMERTVTVDAWQSVSLDLELQSRSVQMKVAEVVGERRTESETAVVMETRQSQQVVNGVGRQQIAKSQDRTASDVVKRIPGVTVVNDRFVMIRGLADRYNTVLLNDVTAPSLEPDKRAFSFDLIPSGALDRVMIYKTGAPELPGEFAGGVIKIGTLSVPQQNETKVGYGAGVRLGTTFQPFHQDQGSSTDFLGFDNGFRTLPDDFPGRLSNVTDPQQLARLGRELPNNWTATEGTAIPDQRFGLMIARRFGKEGGNTYGSVNSVDYSNTSVSYDAKTYNYNAYDPEAQRSDTIYKYNDNENIHTARVSVLSNWTALLGKRTKLEFRNLFNQIGENRSTLRTGQSLEEGFDVRNYAFRWQQRTIYSGQVHGSHELSDRTDRLEWTLGYSKALSKEPDLRRMRTTRDIEQTDSDEPFQLVIPPTASTLDAARFHSDLDEAVVTGRVDYEHGCSKPDAKVETTVRGGLFGERKDRTFAARWMSFTRANIATFDQSLPYRPLDEVFADENINPTTGFELEEGTNPSDRYTAANTLMAGYAGATLVFNKLVTLSGGVRVEHNTQELSSATFGGDRINVDNTVTSVLPSLNASLNLTERSLVRVAWSNTVNRPEFRELAPFSFYDFSFNNVLYGNPDVQVATIMNLDARWEFYPSASEMISVGAFYKDFTDPIEMFFVPGTGSGGTRNFTYGNADNAQSLGAEVEIRRSLNGIFHQGHLSHLGVLLNATIIQSKVDLGAAAVGQERNRPMTGQSPYVVNGGLYYADTEHKLQYNVLYNIFGRRLFAAGTYGTPDIYEMPRHSLDVTLTKGLGEHFEIKLGAQDLLNQETLLQQDSDANGSIEPTDERIQSYKRGTYLTAAVGFTF